MANLTYIDKSIVENPDFTNPTQDIIIDINVGGGESVSFVAQKEFFTPRRIATNRGDVALMNNVVEYTPANIPVIKLPGVNQDLTDPQYYLNSIVSDRYQPLPVDKYFLELDNDLAPPAYTGSLLEQRQLAMNTLLNLQDAAAAAIAGDQVGFTEASVQVDENYAELAGLQNVQELSPDEMLTPEEADQLAALDLVGVGTAESSDIAADTINPAPEINDSDLIRFGNKVALLQGKTAGTDTINKAIKLLNSGVQAIENDQKTGMTEDGKCKFITVAKGKKGILGTTLLGKKERKVSREDTEKKLALVKEDIAAQQASPSLILQTKSGFSPLVKITKSSFFGKLVGGIAKAGFLASVVGVIAAPFTGGASLALAAAGLSTSYVSGVAAVAAEVVTAGRALTVPAGYKPMSKDQALSVLQKTQKELEGILAKDC